MKGQIQKRYSIDAKSRASKETKVTQKLDWEFPIFKAGYSIVKTKKF